MVSQPSSAWTRTRPRAVCSGATPAGADPCQLRTSLRLAAEETVQAAVLEFQRGFGHVLAADAQGAGVRWQVHFQGCNNGSGQIEFKAAASAGSLSKRQREVKADNVVSWLIHLDLETVGVGREHGGSAVLLLRRQRLGLPARQAEHGVGPVSVKFELGREKDKTILNTAFIQHTARGRRGFGGVSFKSSDLVEQFLILFGSDFQQSAAGKFPKVGLRPGWRHKRRGVRRSGLFIRDDDRTRFARGQHRRGER